MRSHRTTAWPVLLTALASVGLLWHSGQAPPVPPDRELPAVHPNDNRLPAGQLRGDTLELQLEVRRATWRPESDTGPSLEVAAFGEAGRDPSIPGPLIRVRTGTAIGASDRHRPSDSTITVRGLPSHPAVRDD